MRPLPIYRRRSPNEILRTGRARAAADCKHIHRVVDSRIAVFMHPVSGAVRNPIVLVTGSRSPQWFACCSSVLARHVLSTFGTLPLLRTAVCARVRSTPSRLRARCAQSVALPARWLQRGQRSHMLPLLGPLMHCAECRVAIQRAAQRSGPTALARRWVSRKQALVSLPLALPLVRAGCQYVTRLNFEVGSWVGSNSASAQPDIQPTHCSASATRVLGSTA